ncbi:ABC transporter ATP-binding protein [Pollutimonas bauzanensis]|uniref:Amino acid/amide ABC transporter ATP-binding protein 2, HAAT family n=1 Tax=Pollutimonas bauzanensis TaxID=658167 RepID=A0A1M5UUS4_9BURK|nr:ABC transporter ATP-binding protein [Pollutimonas bauzanensis]SHH66503.1 amino acid/amide ABC transporter ATP-binding protein 2, HAAT family [Pollutimonas bauzanensis]
MPDPILRISGVDVRYGRTLALSDIDIDLFEGEAVGLLGTNGAGKTTLLNALSGFLRPAAGELRLFGASINRCPPHVIVRRGLLHLSQERDLFGDLTVHDNLRLGSLARAAKSFDRNLERVCHYFPRLKERLRQRASTMSGGEQQMLAIGRALMAEPRVLLFDEPSAGLSPLFVQEIGAMMQALRKEGEITIILVEQNMLLAAQVIDRYYMLRAGRIVARGPASELEKDHEELAREYYL